MKLSKFIRWGSLSCGLLLATYSYSQTTAPKILSYSSGQTIRHNGSGAGDTFNISFNGGSIAPTQHKDALNPPSGTKCMAGFKYGVVLSPNTFEKELFASKGYFPDYIQLSWEVVRFQSQITGFKIFRKQLGSSEPLLQVANISSSSTSWQDQFAEAGVLYEYKLRAEGIFSIEIPFLNTLSGIGFRLPSGKVSGRVTYKGGGAVQGVTLIPETTDNFAGSSLALNGSSSYLAISPKANDTKFSFANNFTFQAWVKPTTTGNSTLFEKGTQYKISHQNGKITFNAGGTNLVLDFTQKVDTFFNITAQRTADSLKIYVMYDDKVYYKKSIAFTGTTPANSNEILIGKSANNSAYFGGNLDEIRIWSRALTQTEILRESFRLISGTEDGLSGYYRLNEGVGTNFYDLSRKGFTFNENHGFMSSGVSWSSIVPLRAQLSVKGFTDVNGNYLITGIPYTSDGSTYRIVPAFGVHTFDPTERLLFMGPGSNVYSDVNFEDVASFPVTGKVFYKGTKFPVSGVSVKIDGQLAVNSDGFAITSDALGEFRIDVPIGKHQLQLTKQGHVFRGGGYFPDSLTTFDFQQAYVIQQNFLDTTLVKVIGKVVGGPVEEAKSVGLGRSLNNIGNAKITLSTQKEFDLKIASTDSTGKWENRFTHHLTGSKKYGETNFKITNPKEIEIKPDPTTGEYYAYLLPEKYVIKKIVAGNPDAVSPKYTFDNTFLTTLDLSLTQQTKTEKDSVPDFTKFTVNQQNGDTTYAYLYDSVQYQTEKNFTLRLNPSVDVASTTPNVARFWEDKFKTKEGNEVSIVSSDAYGAWLTAVPVFLQRKNYKVKISVFEAYVNVNNGGATDKVPVIDGVVRIQNDLAIDTKINDYKINEFGNFVYEFEGGLPNTTGDYQKTMTVKVFTGKGGSIATDWPTGGTPFKGYVFGGLPTGNNFVTQGPNLVNMILRDPHGSNSYAFYESGVSTTNETSVDIENSENTSLDVVASLGGEVKTFAGLGAGVIIETESNFDIGSGLSTSKTYTSNNTFSSTTTNTTRWSTSAETDFVGANGDLFIGQSTNIVYGKNVFVELLPDLRCDAAANCVPSLSESGKNYNIGLSNGIRISPKFATAFQYTQSHIENSLIPNLKQLRDAYYLKKRNTNATAGRKEYECVICSGDLYGSSNDLKTIQRRVDNSGVDGNSYKITYPVGFDFNKDYIDSLAWYNQQIKGWEDLLARNEKEKAEAILKQNLSYDAGSIYESSVTVEDSKSKSDVYTINVDRSVALSTGFDALGLGWSIDMNTSVSKGKTTSSSTGETKSATFGYVLNDGDAGDYYSVDVKDARTGTGPVFAVKGGQSMCPYVDAEKTKYHNPGTIISEATMRREVPKVAVEKAIVSGVLQGNDANFKLIMSNAAETGDDAWYRLSIIEESIIGGNLKIDGASITNGRTFFIPGGGTLTKSLNLSQAIPDSFKFENIQVVLHSLCEQETIADTVEISAYFQPACSPILISDPSDKWLVNTSKINFSGTEISSIPINIGIDGYDLNHTTFEKILVQYKASSSAQWIADMVYYKDKADFDAASEPKKWINGFSSLDYTLEMKSLQDRNYDVRLQSVCGDGTLNNSEILSGIKDIKRPKLFGTPQPGDGVLSPGDDIQVNFDENIYQGNLTSFNFSVRGVLNGGEIAHNSVVYFDGVDDYTSVVEGINLNDKSFAIEFWTKRLRDGVKETVFAQGDLEIGFNANNTLFASFDATAINSTLTFPAIDTWEHFALSYDKSTKKVSVYKNDLVVIDQLSVNNAFMTSGRLNVGKNLAGANPYNGYVHDLRIWESDRGYGSVVANQNKMLTGDEVGLSGFYPMDEATGLVALDKSRNRHAQLNGATWAVFPRGYARNFSGSSNVAIPAGELIVTNDMDMTVEFWMKASAQTNTVIFSNGKGDNTEASPPFKNIWVLGADANGKFYAKNNGTSLIVNKNVFDNEWHHVALVLKRIANTAIYIDGNQEVFKQSTFFGGLSGAQVALGARQSYSAGNFTFDQNFTGKLDEVRIWKLARTKQLIELDKNAKLKGNEVGLMAYYPFDAYDANLLILSSLKDQVASSTKLAVASAGAFDNSDVPNIKDARPVQNVNYNWVVNGDKMILNLTDSPELLEKTIIEITVRDVEDLNENRLASPITWTAYIRKNTVLWGQNSLSFSKNLADKVSFKVDIINKGGVEQSYNISNLPSWLSIDAPNGTLLPDSKKTLNFEISDAANIGNYEQSIYLGSDFGFLEKLEIKLKVKGTEPVWVVNATNFDNNMSVVGVLRLNNIISTNPDDKIAAFVGNEIRGVANLEYISAYDQYEFFLDIYSNEAGNEKIEFRVWNASEGKIQVNVTPELTFEKNGIVGSPSAPQEFEANSNVSIAYNLKKGWNWISFNVNSSSLNNSNVLLKEIDSKEGDIIKTLGKFDQYNTSAGWLGEISKQGGFDLPYAYKVKVTKADTFSVVGSNVETQNINIPLFTGWNWIGFPSQKQLSLNNALANVSFQNGDFIKGQNGFAIYDQFLGWVGSLKTMQPTKGYMIKTASNHTLNYPNPELLTTARLARVGEKEYANCTLLPEDYGKDMAFVIQLDLCNNAIDSESDYLMVKVGGECRGAIEPTYIESSEKYLFFLSAFANVSGEKLEFSFFDASQNKGLEIIETQNFVSDGIVGDIESPLALKVSDKSICKLNGIENGLSEILNVYPNPFDNSVEFDLREDLKSEAKLYITDVSGRRIASLNLDKTILWDGKSDSGQELPTGVYLVNVETLDNTYKLKLVKK